MGLALLCLSASLKAQYSMTIEEHALDIVPGTTTFRFYIDMVNTDDFLSSVYGDPGSPLSMTTTDGFYNNQFGSTTAGGINPAFLPFFPDLLADSWVTIGIDSQPTGDQAPISHVESASQPWVSAFAYGSSDDGGDFAMDIGDGGAWYVLNGASNGLPDAVNNRVLFMQMTTSGGFSGAMNVQVFEHGAGAESLNMSFGFNGVGTYFQSEDLGCMDALACNFDAEALGSDGFCIYPDSGYGCDGSCLVDSNLNGVCDEFEGCTYSVACNYNESATLDDGSCDYCFCLEGTQWNDSLQGCEVTEAALAMACGEGTYWDDEAQACLTIVTCSQDLDGDGTIGVEDLMQLLSVYATDCEAEDVDPELGEFTCGDPMNYHGYDYATVQIGEQCWFAENLQTTKYLSGDEISNLTTALNEEWQYADSGAYSNYQYWNLSEVEMVSLYGRLYNQFAVQDERGLCPNDWHVPHRFEFEEMIEFVGGEEEAGDALKSSPEDTPSWTGNNSSGFSGAPGGLRDFHGPFSSFGGQGFWWSQTFTEMGVVGGQGEVGFYWGFRLNNNGVSGFNEPSSMGTSIRCLKDTQ